MNTDIASNELDRLKFKNWTRSKNEHISLASKPLLHAKVPIDSCRNIFIRNKKLIKNIF